VTNRSKVGDELTILGTSWLFEDELTKSRGRVDQKGDELTRGRVDQGTSFLAILLMKHKFRFIFNNRLIFFSYSCCYMFTILCFMSHVLMNYDSTYKKSWNRNKMGENCKPVHERSGKYIIRHFNILKRGDTI
jgi:hypothetical protein